MILSDRDYLFFETLLNQRVLTLKQVESICWSGCNSSYVYARTRQVEVAGYVKSMMYGLCNRKIFFLTYKGFSFLRKDQDDQKLCFPQINLGEIKHDLLVNDVRIKFQKMGFPGWVSERLLFKDGLTKGLPDGAVELPGKGRIAIEMELTQKSKRCYRSHLFKLFRGGNFVLCIYLVTTPSTKRMIDSQLIGFDKVYVGFLDEFLEKGFDTILSRRCEKFPLERLRRYAGKQ